MFIQLTLKDGRRSIVDVHAIKSVDEELDGTTSIWFIDGLDMGRKYRQSFDEVIKRIEEAKTK